jgi:hypothetical protein
MKLYSRHQSELINNDYFRGTNGKNVSTLFDKTKPKNTQGTIGH